MRNALIVVGILSLFLWVQSCVEPPSYPDEPVIEFVSLSTDTILELTDTLAVTFSFTDGDGDLGFEDFSEEPCDLCDSSCYTHPTYSIFILDSRRGVSGDTCLTPFSLPFIPTKGASDAISGEIRVNVSGIFCFPDLATDTFSFNIQLRDRSGNFSNAIQTPTVNLQCL